MNERQYMEYDEQAARERRARRIQEMKRQKARRLLIQKCVMIALPILAVVLVGTVILTKAGKASAKPNQDTVQGENAENGENLLANAGNTDAENLAGDNTEGGTTEANNSDADGALQDTMQEPQNGQGSEDAESTETKKVYAAQATDDTLWIGDEIISTNAIFIDLETGNILGQKDPYKVLSPASMTNKGSTFVVSLYKETPTTFCDFAFSKTATASFFEVTF